MKVTKKILLTSVISITSIVLTTSITVSCSGSKKNEIDNEKTELQKLVEEKKIEIKINPTISISENVFNQYKNNLKEIKKMFKLSNQSNLDIEFIVLSAPQWNSDTRVLSCSFQIKNINNNEIYDFEVEFNYFAFSSYDQYIKEANKLIVENISLKDEYKNKRIVDLFENINTIEEFIEKYIDYEKPLENIIGINYELTIPTQTMNMKVQDNNYFKFNIKLFDLQGNNITPDTSSTIPYLRINNNKLKDTFTIINSEDLKEAQLLYGTKYLGKIFILSKTKNFSNELIVNCDFSNKTILGTLDFSNFLNINFGDNARFDNNKITFLKFNSQSKVVGLNGTKFNNNLIKTFDFPISIDNFSYTCFDSSVTFTNINNLSLIHNVVDDNNNLNLTLIKDETTLKNTLEILDAANKKEFNNIYLPELQSSTLNSYSLSCNEIFFYEKENQEPYEFNLDLRKWNIKSITIPSFIYKIKKDFSNCQSIKREFNNETLSFIENNVLTINTLKKYSWWNVNQNLWTETINYSNLDSYFYSFNSTPLEIREIKFNQNSIATINTNQFNFLKNSNLDNKKIIFDSNVKFVNVDSYYNLSSMSTNIEVERKISIDNSFIQNGTLSLENLYNQNPTEPNLNTLLVGLEKYINSIDTANVTEIRQNLFKSLKWDNLTINLKGITKVSQYAFYESSIKINTEGFDPISILNHAFYKSSIAGYFIFNNLIELGTHAFYGTQNINSITFKKLIRISSYCFQNSLIKNVISDTIETIDSYAFSSSKIELINLPNLKTINSSAFSYSSLKTINLENVVNISNYAFQSCSSLTGNIVLNENVELGLNVFQNSSKLTLISNFNFDKYSIINNISNYFSSSDTKIISSISDEQLYSILNYDSSTGILDLSNKLNNDIDDVFINYLMLLINKIKNEKNSTINEFILPQDSTISSRFKYVFRSIKINKLTWKSKPGFVKTMNSSLNTLLDSATIYSINEDFCVGMTNIINYAFNSTIKAQTINLKGVKKINNNAFKYFTNTTFTNTEEIKEIGSNSFSETCIFNISTDVKLQEDSFSKEGVINNPSFKITRNQIFSLASNFIKIYDEGTKILDFSKISISRPDDYTELNNFRNISEYLMDGDVLEIILPPVYTIGVDLYSNLGIVPKITFQQENELIVKGAFQSTSIQNKPKLDETHIFIDEDNFLSY